MNRDSVIEELIYLNRWRKGEDIKQPNPREISKAIDAAIEFLKEDSKSKSDGWR